MGKKIILLSKYDFGGSGHRMAEAIGTNSNNFVLPIITHPFKFPHKLSRVPSLFKSDKELNIKGWFDDIERVQQLINEADIIHFKGDSLPILDFIDNVQIPDNKPLICTVCGTFFRERMIAPIDEYVKKTVFRSALTPDINYPEYMGEYIPHAYPIGEYSWQNNKLPIICHSPSDNSKKGTETFKLVCDMLKDEGLKFKIDIINNVNHIECIRRKSRATIFFDQIGDAGFYGTSLIEAIALGIPSISYISEQSIKQANGKLTNMPDIDCGNTVESLFNKMYSLLTGNLEKFSKECYEWSKFHSYKSVGNTWDEIYKSI